VLERVIENWLAKSTERTYQLPFCYMLSRQGYTRIHLTRHCAMELGVDIIAIARDGVPCAFQLKSGKISLSAWRDISRQVTDLVFVKPAHPSITNNQQHRTFLVTNNVIEEEVQRAIDGLNRTLETKSVPPLQTIVGGQLFQWAKELESDLWPTELTDTRLLLEIYLEDGKNFLPKEKLSSLFEKTIVLERNKNGKPPSKEKCKRAISSGALLCSIATHNFSNQENHVAVIEAWTIYIASVFALAERYNLNPTVYSDELEIAEEIIFNSLSELYIELKDRKTLIEGNASVDSAFIRIRIISLLAFASILVLWKRIRHEDMEDYDKFYKTFIEKHIRKLQPWGEGAIPQLLSIFWYFTKVNATSKPEVLLINIMNFILHANKEGYHGVPSPYYEISDLLPYIIDSQIRSCINHNFRMSDKPFDDDFRGRSYLLEGMFHLIVKRRWKQYARFIWPQYTRIANVSFEYEKPWHFFRWRNKTGIERTKFPLHTKDWAALKNESLESEGNMLPATIKKFPILVLLFTIVYPHRLSAGIIRWLDKQINQID